MKQKPMFILVCFLAICMILQVPTVVEAVEWAATLTATSSNTVVAPQTVSFKTVDGATGSYDASDGVAPPEPQSPILLDVYFPVSGSQYITRLSTDAKADTTDSVSWPFGLRADSAGGTLSWDVSGIPSDRKVTLTLPDSSTVNMKTTASTTYVVVNGSHQTYTVTVVGDQKPTGLSPTTASVGEDSSGNTITLSATDPEGQAITYAVTTNPTNGSLSGTVPSLTYSPNANFYGTDTFAFSAGDGTSIVTQEVTITVSNDNTDPPVASDQSKTIVEETAVDVTLSATDLDGDTNLTYSIVSDPANGTASLSGAVVTYTPNANFNGSDLFTFKATDSTGLAGSASTVSIVVSAVNDVPVANGATAAALEDTATEITLSAADVDEDDTITYSIVSDPANGTASLSGAVVTYTPNLNFNGADSFTFKTNDGTVDSNVATVSITVSAVNDVPVANGKSVRAIGGRAKEIILLATDVDEGATLTYSIVSGPVNGTASLTGNVVTYTSTASFLGADSFTFKANDGMAGSNVVTVDIVVKDTPGIASTLPVDGATNVPVGILRGLDPNLPNGVSMTFDRVMNHDSILDSVFSLTDVTGDTPPVFFHLRDSQSQGLINIILTDIPTSSPVETRLNLTAASFALLENNQYKVELLMTSAVDIEEIPLYVGDAVFTFTTGALPRIVSTSPANGAVNVPVDVLSSSGSGITVTFSKAMDQASVRQSVLTLIDLAAAGGAGNPLTLDLANTANLLGLLDITTTPTTLTVKYASGVNIPLAAGHRYIVILGSTQAKDTNGNPLSYEAAEELFVFATQDDNGAITYPTIVSTAPVDGASDVSTEILNTTGVSLTFSMPMDENSVRNSQFNLVDVTDSSNNLAFDLNSSFVDADFDSNQTTVTVKFVAGGSYSLAEGNDYKVELVSTGAHKLGDASKSLIRTLSDAVFTFSTGLKPRIASTSPADGAVNVPVDVLSSSGS